MEEEEDEEAGAQYVKRGARGATGKAKREKQKFFALRDPHLAAGTAGSSTATSTAAGDMQQLQELFGASADSELIAAVYEQSGSSLAAAVEALLGLFGQEAAEQDQGTFSGVTPGGTGTSTAGGQGEATRQMPGPCRSHLSLGMWDSCTMPQARPCALILTDASHAQTTSSICSMMPPSSHVL